MVELSGRERRAVEAALAATRDRRQWVRLRAVLLTADGVPSPEVCRDLGLGRSTLFAWLAAWRETRDPAALADAPRSGQPPVLKADHRARLEQLLGEEPGRYGYKATGWTVPLLAIHFTEVEHVPVSETTLRRVLHALGYRWKRPRYVLARRDPERAGKKGGARGRGGARARGGAQHRDPG
jgi:transposase